jgi:hypothetical protein
MTSKATIDALVDRFLTWRLPDDFAPDCGITFTPHHPNGIARYAPVGTNLLHAGQARAMFEYLLAPLNIPDNEKAAALPSAFEARDHLVSALEARAERVRTPAPMPTGTERAVCDDITARQQHGIAKYGVTVQDNPLPLRAWLQHAYEECLDQAVYLKRAMQQLDADAQGKKSP